MFELHDLTLKPVKKQQETDNKCDVISEVIDSCQLGEKQKTSLTNTKQKRAVNHHILNDLSS